MKNKIRSGSIIFISAIFLLWRCGSFSNSSSIARQNFAAKYNSDEKVLRPKYVLQNVTDSLIRLYFSVNSSDLLYANNYHDNGFSAHVLLTYIVHPIDFPKIVTDSGHVVLSDEGKPGDSKLLASSTDMDVFIPGEYYLEVTFRDLNKMTASYELLYLDHRGKNSRNNFLLTFDGSETPLFRNYVGQNEKFRIHYYNPLTTKLFVRYYKNKSGPAPPPYAVEKHVPDFTADSSWWMNYSPGESVSLEKEGFYTFTTDTISAGGLTVARFHEGFPKISVPKQLLYPLRYLTMREEYVAMDTASNTKKAVDAFWINNTGSQERAREVIRNFYNRVEAANTLFATQVEGWKTDRGMIYLIFGPPENVYRTLDSETWIYGITATNPGLTFVFDHKTNAFTDEEFILERTVDFKINWITAVDSWRQGHIYTLR